MLYNFSGASLYAIRSGEDAKFSDAAGSRLVKAQQGIPGGLPVARPPLKKLGGGFSMLTDKIPSAQRAFDPGRGSWPGHSRSCFGAGGRGFIRR